MSPIDPTLADAMRFHTAGDFAQAERIYRELLARDPGHLDALKLLGRLLMRQGRSREGMEILQRTVELEPDHFESQLNLGAVLMDYGFFADAGRHFQKAAELRPDFAGIYNNIGNLHGWQGQVEEAVTAYRRALQLDPADAPTHSNLIFALNHHPAATEADLAAEHARWNAQHARSQPDPPHPNTRDLARILRVGYISGDFGANQGAFFIEPMLAFHRRDRVVVNCYSTVPIPDATTLRMRGLADDWQDVASVSDDDLAAEIRADAIDILVDLSAHSRGNRLTVFARHPAPVQMTYLGYPASIGLPAVPYRITDVHLDPPGGTRADETERLIRLPETYFCYQPPRDAPMPSPTPARSGQPFTFGSFNKLNKLNEPTVRLWASVLQAMPNSRLRLKAHGLRDEVVRQLVRSRFAPYGVAPERIEMLGFTPLADHLKLHNDIDVALDPLVFNGGTTSLHAMWMGVPVVTLAGQTARSRMGVSLLSNVGLTDLIADSADQYVAICASLAADVKRLDAIRADLRNRMLRSRLTDRARFIAHLEDGYRAAWRNWCISREPVDITL